ncbi:MAG TPA: DoxX family protein [Casimicrobiaceae bacterium]|nr:DoxX family protein [Casimicrobiaceae bacterium]
MNDAPSPPRVGSLAAAYCTVSGWVAKLEPLLLLGFRLYVARVFFMSGLTKTRDWSSTVALFTDEYHVPLLSPPVAAALGAATELSMPVLLALGLGSRFAAGVLFVFNIVAVASYYDTLVQTGGVKDHVLWGTMLLVLTICGPGRIAVDTWLERRYAASAD